jgi:hypothetical protein
LTTVASVSVAPLVRVTVSWENCGVWPKPTAAPCQLWTKAKGEQHKEKMTAARQEDSLSATVGCFEE